MEHVFFRVPEWKGPQPAKTEEGIQKEGRSSDPPKEWEWKGDESMHPFWAIQRTREEKKDLPSNMTFQNLSLNSVTVGAVAGAGINLTAEVTVPFLTNSIEIPKGAELVLKIDQVKQEKKREENYLEGLLCGRETGRRESSKEWHRGELSRRR